MSRRLSLLAALLLGSAACRSPSPTPDALPKPTEAQTQSSSVLGKGDVVEVHVFQEPDFSGAYRVTSTGTLEVPFCKGMAVLGLTPEEVAAKLTVCLEPRVLRNPQISVTIRDYNSKKIFVVGEVQKPGNFPYEDNMSIIQAITLAGGFTKTAAKNSVNLTRLVEGQETKVKVQVDDIAQGKAPNMTLLPGDIIYVPESFF